MFRRLRLLFGTRSKYKMKRGYRQFVSEKGVVQMSFVYLAARKKSC